MQTSPRSSEAEFKGAKVIYIDDIDDGSDVSSVEHSSSDEDESRWLDIRKGGEIPSQYWEIQKLMKYMKIGDQTVTIASLCFLRDHDLHLPVNQMAICDIGGLEVLVNLLDTHDMKCKIGSLAVLKEISNNHEVRKKITFLGIIPLLNNILSDPARDLQILAAETIANIANFRTARRVLRKCGGIPKLIDLLDVSTNALMKPYESLTAAEKEEVSVASGGAKALWSLSISQKNKEIMRKTGIIPLMARLIKSCHTSVVVPIMGTLQECATEANYKLAIETEGMVGDIVRHLSNKNVELITHAASAIFKCAVNEVTREMVYKSNGLEPLVNLVKSPKVKENKPLMAAVTGAIWKCAMSKKNVDRFDELKTVSALIPLLFDTNEEVLTNVVGALAQCLKKQSNREIFRISNGLPQVVNLLNEINQEMLENVACLLGESAQDLDSMIIIEELDAVRLIWSLLKNPSPRVQANAAKALVPCIQNARESGEMVRSLVGGLDLIVSLLKSTDINVLSAVCAAVSKIATDMENLAIITDLGVIPMLANLVCYDDCKLRQHLAEAIANCCSWGINAFEFGRLGSISPLVANLTSTDKDVHRATTQALHQLSNDPFNCITMHQSGVVPLLLRTIGSTDPQLQEASAGCLRNIRKLALAAEKHKYKV